LTSASPAGRAEGVLRFAALQRGAVETLAHRFGMDLVVVADGAPIPGSFWGPPEAGLVARRLHVRGDTPAHSLLHELSHFVCMTPDRRVGLETDAGGDTDEECAVCYLELLLAETLPGFGLRRCLADMDAWGYSFREGSARAWFEGDGADALAWLVAHGIVDTERRPTGTLRAAEPTVSR
jgi:hypothetical protein